MIEKEFVVEFLFKEKMMIRSFPKLKAYLIKELKHGKTKSVPFRRYTLTDALTSIKNIEKTGQFDYFDAFSLSVVFSSEYLMIKDSIVNGQFNLDVNFKREDYWRNEDIHFEEGLYFSYTFLNETYKQQLSIDLKKLSEKIDGFMISANPSLIANVYLKKIKQIKKEEDRS